jgi:hypothetical protein
MSRYFLVFPLIRSVNAAMAAPPSLIFVELQKILAPSVR